MRRHARVWFAIAALASFFAFATSAAADYSYKGAFSGGPGSLAGELSTPGRAAVEQSTGNLFVVDSANGRVQVFAPNGSGTADYLTEFGTGELSSPWGIAIDENGGQTSVYVADAGNNRIVNYNSDEEPTPSFTAADSLSPPEVGNFKAALAIDPTSHELLVADNANKLIERFEADGDFVSSFDGSNGGSALEGPIDIAVNTEGDIYVVDANGPNVGEQQGTSKVLRYAGVGEYKATLGPVGYHERPNAVAINLHDDSVVVAGDPDNVYEAGPSPYQPVLGVFDSSNAPLPSPSLDAAAQYDAVSGLAIASGSEDRLYVVLDQGSWGGSPYGTVGIRAFRQPHPAAPQLLGQSASATQREATLRATINSGNLDTSYRFEYGSTPSYGQSTSTRTIPAGDADVTGAIAATGLSPLTTYHYRAIVENAEGRVVGPDATVTTRAIPGIAQGCPNEAFRTGVAAQLPNCRAYEMVSPLFKTGTDIHGFRGDGTRISTSGDRAIFYSIGGFSGQGTVYGFVPYLASRTSTGWQSEGISPTVENSPINLTPIAPQAASDDLGNTIFSKYNPPLDGATPNTVNLYLRKANGTYANLTPSGPTTLPDVQFYQPYFAAGSADFEHLIFESTYAMAPGAVSGVPNLYEWTPAGTRLVGILPNGEPAPAGSAAGPRSTGSGPGASAIGGSYTEATISQDGSRIFWTDLDSYQIYARIGGTTTQPVSKSQRTNDSGPGGTDPLGPQPAMFVGATPSGSVVYFTSSEKLTNDATADASAGQEGERKQDLYAYDVASQQLTDLSVSLGESADVLGLVGASDDGSYVYFAANGALAPEAISGGGNIYQWHNGEVRLVGTVNGDDAGPDRRNWNIFFAQAGGPKMSRVTPDGRAVLLGSTRPMTGYPTGDHLAFYRYDDLTGELTCVSCNPRREKVTEGASVIPPGTVGPANQLFQKRLLSASGRRVFFNSPEALVAEDTNNQVDVYEWENGDVSLISSGQSSEPSYFADASASGNDAFFVTRERLSPADTDDNVDLYDARVNGGIALTGDAGNCQGEDCQPAGSSPPLATTPGSGVVAGQGNAKPRRNKQSRCAKPRKGKKAKAGAAKKRCAPKKKQAAKKKRAAAKKQGGVK